ncbi:unnamed protein product [Camellia sinensis]
MGTTEKEISRKKERKMRMNPGEGVVRTKAGADVTAVNPIDGVVGAKTEPRFKPKIGGGLIYPPKRKLVKKLMWDCMVQAIASCFHPNPISKPPYSSEFTVPINHTCKKKKTKKIFPA